MMMMMMMMIVMVMVIVMMMECSCHCIGALHIFREWQRLQICINGTTTSY